MRRMPIDQATGSVAYRAIMAHNRSGERIGAKKIITLAASHASLASMPAEVCALIDEAANASS
jgi:hypothetical protein